MEKVIFRTLYELIKKNDIRIPKLIQAVQNTVGTYYKAYERI